MHSRHLSQEYPWHRWVVSAVGEEGRSAGDLGCGRSEMIVNELLVRTGLANLKLRNACEAKSCAVKLMWSYACLNCTKSHTIVQSFSKEVGGARASPRAPYDGG